jgi:hypothetical protein
MVVRFWAPIRDPGSGAVVCHACKQFFDGSAVHTAAALLVFATIAKLSSGQIAKARMRSLAIILRSRVLSHCSRRTVWLSCVLYQSKM